MKRSPNRRMVGPSGKGGEQKWQVKAPGATKASSLHRTKAEATDAGRRILKNSGGGELTLQNVKGQIIDSDTVAPGNDPNPPKDTK